MRFPAGQRNLLAFALIAGLGFVVTLYLVPSGSTSEAKLPETGGAGAEAVAYPSPVVPDETHSLAPEDTPPSEVASYRGYALPIAEIRGLSAATPPGTRIQIWVAWEPPITREARVQRLRGVAIVEEIVEPTLPEGPTTVELLISEKRFAQFLYAHRYGALSAAAIP